MPKIAKELSPLAVRRLTEPGMYAAGGARGLHLRVAESGARSWILRVVVGDRRRDLGLGPFPEYGVAEARERAKALRDKIADGIDPVEHKRAAKAALSALVPFSKAVDALLEAKAGEFSNPKHEKQWASTLKQYAVARLGSMPVASIRPDDVAECLRPIWNTIPETARRVRGRIETVIAYSIASGWASLPNAAALGPIKELLGARKRRATHFASMPYAAVPAFMKKLSKQPGVAAKALRFAVLTAARSGEVRGATWGEIDLKAKTWCIPAEHTKMRRDHVVTLNPEALALLKSLARGEDTDIIFGGRKGQALSDMALTKTLRDMGETVTAHGYRASFRTWAAEQAHEFPREIAEAALAHVNSDRVEAAYQRSTHLARRRDLLDRWGGHCSGRTIAKRGKS